MEKIKLLVVDDVAQTRKDIIRLLYFEEDMQVVGEAGDGEVALRVMGEVHPDVVLMDINMPKLDGITATERACRLYPNIGVVIISIQGESEYLKKAMVAGARDYLVKPLSSEEMAITIRSVYRQQQLRGNYSKSYPDIDKESHAIHQNEPERHVAGQDLYPETAVVASPALSASTTHTVAETKPTGQVIVVFSGKGGVGKTTIATNLAVVLAQQEKKKVALIDYDLQFGDIAVMLNLNDGNNISDLVQGGNPLTSEILEGYLIRHFSGIDILPAPLFPQDAEYVSPEHTDTILRILKKNYDYIVVDTASSFNDINLQALDLADQIFLVVTRDIATIKNARTSLNILESLDFRDKIRVVLNRSDQDLGVEIPDLEKGLEITVSHQIAGDEKALVSAINKGVPVVVSHASADITKSFRRLGERTVNGQRLPSTDKNKGFINRIFSL